MKRIVVGVIGLVALAAGMQANAADLPRRSVEMPTKAPVALPYYNWTGLYLGINGGYGWGRSGWDGLPSFSTSGGLIGGTVGYNFHTGPFVVGVEGDIDWTNIKGNTACGTGTCETANTWLGTARARLGYAADRFLPYVTGGLAFGNVNANGPLGSASTTKAGWTVGAGLEYGFTPNISAKIEYLYADLGSMDCGTACLGTAPQNVSFNTNIVRAGLNYRFGGF